MNGRSTYREISRDLMATYLVGCVNRGFRGEDHEAVCSWAYFEFDGAYESPIENLMLEMTALRMTGGWYPKMESYIRARISRIFLKESLSDMINLVDSEQAGGEEIEELVRDMRVLGVVEKDFRL